VQIEIKIRGANFNKEKQNKHGLDFGMKNFNLIPAILVLLSFNTFVFL
jgi:hypothetical protein